jgi:hypothetical protein
MFVPVIEKKIKKSGKNGKRKKEKNKMFIIL